MDREKRRAVFIDRDGILNEMVYDENHGLLDSPRRPEQVRLVPGAADFLKGVKDAGYLAIIVTNQPGVAKHTLTVEEVEALNDHIAKLLAKDGAAWDDLHYCPHHPDGGSEPRPEFVMECECRKPKPGMLVEAAKEHEIDLSKSWMVGDGLTDVRAGKAAGCKTILVTKLKVMHIERFFDMKGSEPDVIAADLNATLEEIRAGE